MKKGVLGLFLVLTILIQPVFADEIEDSIKKITYHAEQYEAGNINYAQLLVYTTSLRYDLAKAMGSSSIEHDPVLKAGQLEEALGKPTETTRWIWVEANNGDGHEKKLDNEIPAWRKLIFDGKKIQMWLSAWPNIVIKDNEENLFYRLHLEIRFKSPEEQLNIKEKIEEIKFLAEEYSDNPNRDSLETLARDSAGVEQSFNNYFNQNPAQCDELMNDIFGSENKRENQNLLTWEINFYEGDNFDAIVRFEMCEDCNWNWISTNMRIEGRGPDFRQPETENSDFSSREKFSSYTSEDFKQETERIVDDVKSQIQAGDYQSAMRKSEELRVITEAWNDKANNVGSELEEKYRIFWETMSEEEQRKCHETYCWIKKEQERREEENRLKKANYEERKNFYSELFSSYEKKEFYYEQQQWEKRLVEEFKEFGEETCDNNLDDNDNGEIDCSDLQCGGKVCGYETVTKMGDDNQTIEEKRELYCIANSCQAREEIVKEEIIACGNHICEEKEKESCAEDCAECFQYEPLQCSGSIIFSGTGSDGCPLEPVCLSEDLSCETDDDCVDPLCGDAACVDGACQITELSECKEAECVDGEEKINHCQSGEDIVVEGCVNGLWRETGIECAEGIVATETEVEEIEIAGNECAVKSDCGNEDDVCSNGRCVTIPQSEETQEELLGLSEFDDGTEESEIEQPEEVVENGEENLETREEENKEETIEEIQDEQTPEIAGNVIFSFFRTFVERTKITGFQIEGDGGSEGDSGDDSESNEQNENEEQMDEETQDDFEEDNSGEDEFERQEREREEREEMERDERREREEDDMERRQNECNERCGRECYDREVRPCVEVCIREDCGEELECNVDEVRTNCETQCKEQNSLESCNNECTEKCLKGEDTWVEPEREEHKEEKFVFTVGGSCRESQGRTESSIWFGGWAGDREEEFNDFHLIKSKYYSNGGKDWCEEDFENLLKQREELENSLNEEFAKWFFEKYVANSAENWEEHISGIFEIYWRDVDISKQITERLQCLNKDSLPAYELMNFKYETEYGSVEFWEEVTTTNQFGEGEKEIISPYMRTWLFPSREFFKLEMKKSMEDHELPGPSEEEKRNALSEEDKEELREDEEFMDEIKEFNENYGEHFVLQLKDFETNEIAFNVYMKINEDELIYFEPMPPEQNPSEDVKAELDVDKLLDIIEFEESGRVELHSPPWDRKQEIGTVEGVVDGARMYVMFMSLMNSIVVTPASAKGNAKFFTRQFFENAMGDGEDRDFEGGPGGCQSEDECKEYCEKPENREECEQFRRDNEF